MLACGRPEAAVCCRATTAAGYARRRTHGAAMLMSGSIGTLVRRFRATIVLVPAIAAVLWLGAGSPAARAANAGALTQQISAGENRVSALSQTVGKDNGRLRQLNASITGLESKIARIQNELATDRAELLQLRRELAAARVRLASLISYEHKARLVLAQQVVASYETPQPSIVSVVLDANGFTNLLEQLSFAGRIRTHDQQIISSVMVARDRVAAQAVRLGMLEGRQQQVTARVLTEQGKLDAAKLTLLDEQMSVTHARNSSVARLATARGQVATLRRQLALLQAQQAAQARQIAASQAIPGAASTAPFGGHQGGSDPIPGFSIGRDDMGVDANASPGAGIYAPLASHLVEVLQGWYAGQPLLLFQFDSPPAGAPSDYWYVAEQIAPVTFAVGTGFQAGQRVASYAASGTGIEIGWGSPTSNTRTLAGVADPAAASPPPGSTTTWGESFKSFFGIP